jgi:5-methylcytosine-specific restriction protein A
MRKLALFEKADGRCHICGIMINAGDPWEVEHRVPIALGGADDETNMSPAHLHCHMQKTKVDAHRLAKAKRIKARHIGIKKRSTWQTKWKRKIDGTTVLR